MGKRAFFHERKAYSYIRNRQFVKLNQASQGSLFFWIVPCIPKRSSRFRKRPIVEDTNPVTMAMSH